MLLRSTLLIAAGLFSLMPSALRAEPPRLSPPLRCEPETGCFIQSYVDHDPGPGSSDFACGARTYDGHNGTDFRIRSLRAQAEVLASADGVVKGARDGMQDVSVRVIGKSALGGRECGNGVVVEHGDGWSTQYCHMAQGSVTVKDGARVRRGDVLGRVGLSGNTEFPHVHLTVRQNGKVVDPFAYGRPPAACNAGVSLWTPEAASAFAYRSRILLARGFADGPVTGEEIDTGTVEDRRPIPASAAVVAWVRLIGVEAGDAPKLVLTGPDGTVLSENKPEVQDRAKAQIHLFVGRKRPPEGWPPGTYAAALSVLRDGKTVSEERFTMDLGR